MVRQMSEAPDLDQWLADPQIRTRHARDAGVEPLALWRAAETIRVDDAPRLGRVLRCTRSRCSRRGRGGASLASPAGRGRCGAAKNVAVWQVAGRPGNAPRAAAGRVLILQQPLV